jgi:hypothetical protein
LRDKLTVPIVAHRDPDVAPRRSAEAEDNGTR